MTDGKTTILTTTDKDTVSLVEIYSGELRDAIIMVREAVHALRTEAAREIKLTIQRERWSLTVEARK